MDFGKKLLFKYGWKEGEGLGKNNNGIEKPIRAHMKFDNMGLGADRAKEFNDHWWERCFTDAATNIHVNKTKNGEIELNVKDPENGVEISTNSYSANKLKKVEQTIGDDKIKYNNFLYSASLTNTGDTIENPFKVKYEDIAVTAIKVLTDEELFKACDGRTAHKGARHGLNLNGKQARLEQQEAELLAKMQNGEKLFQSDLSNNAEIEVQIKSKKCKKKSKEHKNPRNQESTGIAFEEKFHLKKSKKRKVDGKEGEKNSENKRIKSGSLDQILENSQEERHLVRKKKKSKSISLENMETVDPTNEIEVISSKSSKKNKFRETLENSPIDIEQNAINSLDADTKIKQNKKKIKN